MKHWSYGYLEATESDVIIYARVQKTLNDGCYAVPLEASHGGFTAMKMTGWYAKKYWTLTWA